MKKIDLIHRGKEELPRNAVRVLGIDLGTTNSTVSEIRWDPSTPEQIDAMCVDLEQETLQGTYTHVLVPSIVALYEDQLLVGEGAKRLRGTGLRKDQLIFYECKNDIGLDKTYHRAREGFRSATEIGGKLLAFLRDAALRESEGSLERLVVTVPASFQANQRQDTVHAASLAGMDLEGGELLDEPVAAFVDYLMSKGSELVDQLSTPKNLIVFDFGGGTCDVAVFRLEVPGDEGLKVSTLAVSRYHRLGGGDIDAAVVHEVLMPQLREQNKLTEFDLGFTEKKIAVEPALLGVAEQLKIGLCDEIRRLQAFGKYDDEDKSQVFKTAPGSHSLTVGQRELELNSPRITAAEFERLLGPFLDREMIFARETEYRMTCSIFAPLKDAIDRSGLTERDIELCLLVGGSSLIPQVVEAVDQFLPRAKMLTYAERDSVKACISRGAAYQALSLAIQGHGFVRQVCHDNIAIRTGDGLVTLVPRGVPLPYPGGDGQYRVCKALGVPEALSAGKQCELRVELVAEAEGKQLYTTAWTITGPARPGAPLALQYRLDENHVLELMLSRADGGDSAPLHAKIDKPLTNVVNPHSKQLEALEIEENLKTAGWSTKKMVQQMSRLASLYADLNQREKAISTLGSALRLNRVPDAYLLNKLGNLWGETGDLQREERFLREAAQVSTWDGPWFNLALSKRRQGKTDEAIEALEKGLVRERQGPYLVLRAMLADDQDDEAAQDGLLKEAMKQFDPVPAQSDWELGWFAKGARMAREQELAKSAEEERQRRHQDVGEVDEVGKLPRDIREELGDT